MSNWQSAFPIIPPVSADGSPPSGYPYPEPGMSLRDYFAAHAPAMPERWFLDSPRRRADPLWHWGEACAAWAFFYADAMLAEKGKT